MARVTTLKRVRSRTCWLLHPLRTSLSGIRQLHVVLLRLVSLNRKDHVNQSGSFITENPTPMMMIPLVLLVSGMSLARIPLDPSRQCAQQRHRLTQQFIRVCHRLNIGRLA